MDPSLYSHPGFIGGMAGAFLGLLGGVLGTWFSYRNANSEKERRWIILYAASIFIFCTAYIFLSLAVSETIRTVLQIIYSLLLIVLIVGVTRHLNRLHRDTTNDRSGTTNSD